MQSNAFIRKINEINIEINEINVLKSRLNML